MKTTKKQFKPIFLWSKAHFDLFYFLLLVMFGLLHLVFALRTNAYFSQDDFAVLAYLKTHDLLPMTKQFLTQGDLFGFRRTFGYVIVKILFDLFKVNAFPYLFTNHLIHTFNLILLFLVVKHLTQKSFAAFFVSLIFNKFYLFYFANLHEYLVCFLCLLTIYLFFRLPQRLYLALATFSLALLTKEMAFTLPFLLFSLSLIKKTSQKRLLPFFLLLAFYFLYQLWFFLGKAVLPENASYIISYKFPDIRYNLLFYLQPPLLALLAVPPFFSKKFRSLSVLLIAFLTLAPVLFFKNRREAYYLYLPISYFLIYLSLNLPRLSAKTVPVFALVFLVFGGRQVLPLVAWQNFPNWQKVSLENVTSFVKDSLEDKPEKKEINIAHIYLERDAREMLKNSVIDLFLPSALGDQYSFSYDSSSKTITAIKKGR